MSTGDQDEVCRARAELMNLEERRLRLSQRVMRGDDEALEEDRRVEVRLREIAHWLVSVEPHSEARAQKSLEK